MPQPTDQEAVISSLLARWESERQAESNSVVPEEKQRLAEGLADVLGKQSSDVLRLMDSAPGELATQLKGAAQGGEQARASLESLGIDPTTGRPLKRTAEAPGETLKPPPRAEPAMTPRAAYKPPRRGLQSLSTVIGACTAGDNESD